jgi:hypothetical protein
MRRHRRVALFGSEPDDSVRHLLRQFAMELAQIGIRVKNPYATRREFAGREVIEIPGDQHGCPSSHSGCGVVSVIRVVPGHLVDEVGIGRFRDLTVREESAYGPGDGCGRLGRASLFPNDDSLPLRKEPFGPHDLVDRILRESQHQIHDREREQDIGVHKDPHRCAIPLERSTQPQPDSAGQPCLVNRVRDLPTPLPSAFATLPERQDIGETHNPVTTVGQVGRRDVTGIQQPRDKPNSSATSAGVSWVSEASTVTACPVASSPAEAMRILTSSMGSTSSLPSAARSITSTRSGAIRPASANTV